MRTTRIKSRTGQARAPLRKAYASRLTIRAKLTATQVRSPQTSHSLRCFSISGMTRLLKPVSSLISRSSVRVKAATGFASARDRPKAIRKPLRISTICACDPRRAFRLRKIVEADSPRRAMSRNWRISVGSSSFMLRLASQFNSQCPNPESKSSAKSDRICRLRSASGCRSLDLECRATRGSLACE